MIKFSNIKVSSNYIGAIALNITSGDEAEVLVHKNRHEYFISDKKQINILMKALDKLQELYNNTTSLDAEVIVNI
jgi:hypothetical protein